MLRPFIVSITGVAVSLDHIERIEPAPYESVDGRTRVYLPPVVEGGSRFQTIDMPMDALVRVLRSYGVTVIDPNAHRGSHA